MKTDMQLHQDIVAELTWDPRVKEKEIGVAVKNGVVTLTGSVSTYPEKHMAEHIVEGIVGVKAIANDLEVKLASSAARSDTELAHKIMEALSWDIQVPDEKIKVRVANGWVTLDGEVEWKFEKDAAARAVTYLAGVRGVTNNLTIKPTPVLAGDVADQIRNALRRRAEREAGGIVVKAADGHVTLSGSVGSFADRRAAEGAAWAAPGVKDVRDDITVNV